MTQKQLKASENKNQTKPSKQASSSYSKIPQKKSKKTKKPTNQANKNPHIFEEIRSLKLLKKKWVLVIVITNMFPVS